jgi:hypothetical protein
LALWLANNSNVTSIDANGVSIITDTIDLANARIKFENGLVANLTASRISANAMRKFRIFQKYGYFSLDLAKGNIEVFRIIDNIVENDIAKNSNINSNKTDNLIPTQLLGDIPFLNDKKIVFETPEVLPINAMAMEQQSFIDSIIYNNPVSCSLKEGIKALEIADEINKIWFKPTC